jgi:ABC-type multidrug transport system ATPase subunit
LEVNCLDISKRFGYQWIIKNCNFQFKSGHITGISGMNGSGKSTLLRILSGYLSPTSGIVEYREDGKRVNRNDIFRYLSFVGPYTGLIGEFTMKEQFEFHFKFKRKRENITFEEFKDWLAIEVNSNKRITDYSSGMNQRLQLGLAMKSNTSLLILDEPTSFLDKSAKKWFYTNLKQDSADRTVIIASNDEEDFQLCSKEVKNINALKAIS